MIRFALALFLISILPAACAAPATQTSEVSETSEVLIPAQTETLVPTESPAPTKTPTPEATATPVLPEGLQEHIANGGGFDEEKGVAWNEEGLVMWAMDAQGEWIEYNGIVSLPATDGSGAPPLEVPFYADINSAFAAITDELPWNDLSAYQRRDKQINKAMAENKRYYDAVKIGSVNRSMTFTMTDNPEVTAKVSILDVRLPNMGIDVTRLAYASKDTDYFYKRVFIIANAHDLPNQYEVK